MPNRRTNVLPIDEPARERRRRLLRFVENSVLAGGLKLSQVIAAVLIAEATAGRDFSLSEKQAKDVRAVAHGVLVRLRRKIDMLEELANEMGKPPPRDAPSNLSGAREKEG